MSDQFVGLGRQIAKALDARGIATARGGQWTAVQVSDILKRGQPAEKAADGKAGTTEAIKCETEALREYRVRLEQEFEALPKR